MEEEKIKNLILKVCNQYPKLVEDTKKKLQENDDKFCKYFMGITMRESRGKYNAQLLEKEIRRQLSLI